MKKPIFILLLMICATQIYSQKTLVVNSTGNQTVSKAFPDGSKEISFVITGFTSEDDALQTEQFFRTFRGVESCNFVYDHTSKSCNCTGRFYKFANKEYFSFLFTKARIPFAVIDNQTVPVEELKNL